MTLPAMIFAAGLGKRMRPLTAMAPKPLIEVAGRALIDHVVDRLAGAGATRYVVNVHYLADLLEVHVRKRVPDVVISNERDKLLETGGGLLKALPHLGDGPFFVANSDTFWIEGASDTCRRLVEGFDPARMDALLLLAPTVRAIGYHGLGDFGLLPSGELTRRGERTIAPFVYAGFGVFSAAAVADPPGDAFSLSVMFQRMLAARRLFGQRLDGVWLHVGTPGDIGRAEAAIAASAS